MPLCKFCGIAFNWGQAEDRWVPLVPIGEDVELERTFVDTNGALRAVHRAICNYVPAVKVMKLEVPVPAEHVIPPPVESEPAEPSKARKPRRRPKYDLSDLKLPKVMS